ncbi:glycosyltransferase [Candidatus Gottesmanbacteria bacterium]|nr:glycosyltransferase [Candidatus Gottesmanbacteria bacterium]
MNRKASSILYVNFSPYENTGNILDFLLERYANVFLFSFNFHHLGKRQHGSYGKIFHNGKCIKDLRLLSIPVPTTLVFFLLPIRSISILIQLLWHTWRLTKIYGQINTYFTVNAFTSWIGIIAKKLGLVNQTIFWVWDYYPPIHPSKVVMLMRWAYWQFDKIASHSDRVVFLNKRLEILRKKIGIIPKTNNFPIVSIGTNRLLETKEHQNTPYTLGFIGVLKKSQGLDLVFDCAKELKAQFPRIHLIIIGAGPDEFYYRKLAATSELPVSFHGLLSIRDPKNLNVLSQIDIGIALYVPDESNVSYYGDPSKIKDYLSLAIPIITTDVYEFAQKIKKNYAGILIKHDSKIQLFDAIKQIKYNYNNFQKNALKLAKEYNYKQIYPMIFNDRPKK